MVRKMCECGLVIGYMFFRPFKRCQVPSEKFRFGFWVFVELIFGLLRRRNNNNKLIYIAP